MIDLNCQLARKITVLYQGWTLGQILGGHAYCFDKMT